MQIFASPLERKQSCSAGFYALTSGQRAELLELASRLGAFDVLYVDFPWQFRAHSQKGLSRSAEVHYSTLSRDEIAAYPVTAFAAADCVMLSWTTPPFLDQAIDAMRSQGFSYKSGSVWDKTIAG